MKLIGIGLDKFQRELMLDKSDTTVYGRGHIVELDYVYNNYVH